MPGPEDKVKQLEEEIKKYQQEVERLLRERRGYLRVSAHQMKSPISTIIFSADTLIGDYAGKLNSKQLRVVESIKQRSKDLQALILDILELERFRTGEVDLEAIDFTEICIGAIDELRVKFREKNIHFVSDIPHKILIIPGNKVGLKHAVFNVIENAVKYSQMDGWVGFSVTYDETKGNIKAVVEDKGIGIPVEEQKRIFEEFYRAPNARLFDKNGTGFGLAIVKQIIEICGGTISVQSKENEGTTVVVTLPLKQVLESEAVGARGIIPRKRIVIVGGVAAGPKAASRARRLDPDAKITVFEKGNFLAYAGCALPYYISGRLKRQRELFQSYSGFENATEFFRNIKGIEIKSLSEVTAINRDKKCIEYRDILTGREYTEPYDLLILATGSTPVIPEIEGIELKNILTLHGVTDSENIKRSIANDTAKEIVILGGGNVGIETAEALTVSGARVTIVEKETKILPFLDQEMAALVKNHLEHKGVRVVTDERVEAFLGNEKVEFIKLSKYKLAADLVILAAGFKPNSELARDAGLATGTTGAIAVNEYLQTSDQSIYAAGDCIEVIHAVSKRPFYLPLGSLANRQGRVAGSNAAGQHKKFGMVTGTIIIKVFDIHIAKTGLNEKEARGAGFDPVTVYVPDYDRDEFIPQAEMINVKLVADRNTRKLLGVQIVGKGDVAKRIDVAAAEIAHGCTVEDIVSVDLGYAPAYSKAIDTIVTAAHVMQNKLDGLFEGITASDARTIMDTKTNCSCIDVRSPQEYEEERIPGAVSIPLESLRRRIDEIPRDSGVILICETGARSYQAALILKAHGFKDVKILEGGLKMWPFRISRE